MNRLKKIFLGIVLLLIMGTIILYATGNDYIFKAARLTYLHGEASANIDDYNYFDTRVIKSGAPRMWKYHKNFNKIPLTSTLRKKLKELQSAGFLVVKDGEIITEKYFGDYSDSSLTNSFSMSKTFVTMLLGKAIEEGYIESLKQPITDFLPEYLDDSLAKTCTVGDLSAMTSGLGWVEEYYLPFNETAKSYYGEHLENQLLETKFTTISSENFKYKSGNTGLLGLILSRATGKKLSEYLSEKFWIPLGMESSALWSLDDEGGLEKAFCCVSAHIRDFAKMGQLLLQHGRWDGEQLLDSALVDKMTHPNSLGGKIKNPVYGYGVWTDYNHHPPFYSMVGFLGQRVINIPSENIVIVRTGAKSEKNNVAGTLPGKETYIWVEEVLKMFKNI